LRQLLVARKLVLVVLFVALLVGGMRWLVDGDSKPTPVTTAQGADDYYSCHNCETVGVRFDQPVQLSDIESLAVANKGDVISLWRQDAVCIAQRRSQFAYFHADKVVQRQIEKGPPVTDGGYSFGLRGQFVDQWQQANRPGVVFIGAVLFVPLNTTPAGPHVQATAPIDSYITDGAQMVYLQSHEQAMSPLFTVDSSNC
jgi:hypothetical protein